MNTRILAALASSLFVALPQASAQIGSSGGQKGRDPSSETGAKGVAKSDQGVSASQPDAKAIVMREKPSYPLQVCPISGEKLGSDAIDTVAGGHLLRVCCPKCVTTVQADPAKALAQVREAVIAAQKPSYPMLVCPVTSETLGAEAVDHVYGTRLVRLKDKATVEAFEKSPAAFLAKIDKALIDAQLVNYRPTNCPVSGEALKRDAVNHLYGTRLVRFCCNDCVRTFRASPEKFLAVLDKPEAK